ncbi:hypothetical protein F4804DRAFT_313910 [Jackrogersella minutella]|nr:hypothetical protein F4804DRAFT_313910 [Jackrogersella minutella]
MPKLFVFTLTTTYLTVVGYCQYAISIIFSTNFIQVTTTPMDKLCDRKLSYYWGAFCFPGCEGFRYPKANGIVLARVAELMSKRLGFGVLSSYLGYMMIGLCQRISFHSKASGWYKLSL